VPYSSSSTATRCDHKLAQYRATLDAGASPATVAVWIAETEAEKAGYLAVKSPTGGGARGRMSKAEIKAIVDRLAEMARVLASANPADKSEIFRQLGLRLTCHPGREIVEGQVQPTDCGLSRVSEERVAGYVHACHQGELVLGRQR